MSDPTITVDPDYLPEHDTTVTINVEALEVIEPHEQLVITITEEK